MYNHTRSKQTALNPHEVEGRRKRIHKTQVFYELRRSNSIKPKAPYQIKDISYKYKECKTILYGTCQTHSWLKGADR